MRKYLGAAAAAAAATLLMAVPAFASSNAVLSDTAANPNGTNTAVGAVITSNLAAGTNATFFTTSTGTTGISCSVSTTKATVLTNPTAPGTATLSLTNQDFTNTSTNCTINGGGKTVNSITIDHLPYNVSIASGGSVTISPGTSGNIHTTVSITTIFNQTISCAYHVDATSGNVTGNASNTNNDIKFTNQKFDIDTGQNGQCPSTSFFTADYGPQVDSGNGNAKVFTN